MERFEKIVVLDNEIEARLLDAILAEEGIPHMMRGYYDSAYDGIFQVSKGWGHVEAPARHREEILAILNDLTAGRDARAEGNHDVDRGTRAMAESEAQATVDAEPLAVGPLGARKESGSPGRNDTDAMADFAPDPRELVARLRRREEESVRHMRITERINSGLMLDEILDSLYEEMREVIPYNRIGFALIDRQRGAVVARWARSDRPTLLHRDYDAPLAGSTLERIIETLGPRIINDLEAYLHEKPRSPSTELIVREGMRSSLTCPLIVQGKPVGFVFFSSVDKDAYSNAHVAFFQQIAGQLATIVEKGRLYSGLAEQKAVVDAQNLAMTRDLQMARQVQQNLTPRKPPRVPGLEIAFQYEPASQVGGDVLDIVPVGRDTHSAIYVLNWARRHWSCRRSRRCCIRPFRRTPARRISLTASTR